MAELQSTNVYGNLTVSGNVYATLNPFNNIYHSTSVTYGTLWTFFSPILPTVGDQLKIAGGWAASTVLYVASYMKRTSTTVITVYGVSPTTAT